MLDFVLKNEDLDMESDHMVSYHPNEKFCRITVNCDEHQLEEIFKILIFSFPIKRGKFFGNHNKNFIQIDIAP